MTPTQFTELAILPALRLLPPRMSSREAVAMLIAIGLQESRLRVRAQFAGGPARGFLQFEERGGVYGVLHHHATHDMIRGVLDVLCYDHSVETSYEAIEHNDILACVYGRLLLWTHPMQLPAQGEPEAAWQYYLELWRPEKPRPDTWDAFYTRAWAERDAGAGA